MFYRSCIFLVALITLMACGGGGSTPTPSPSPTPAPSPTPVAATVYTGVFIDSAVAGLNYVTTSQSGKTNDKGEFSYQNDETVVFSIGDIKFPSTSPAMNITPLDVFATSDVDHVAVLNMLRLLQTLDLDGDPSNGIEIPDKAHELAMGITVDFTADNFDQSVQELVANSGAVKQNLISAQDAQYHFLQSLDAINVSTCTSTNSRVGYSGTFQTYAHNVAGTATIIDDCTIEITNFDYDGGGPDVYIYAAIDHGFAESSAFSISQKLNGTQYENDTFVLRLPQGKTLSDLNTLSVWCADFNANFGDLKFEP